MWIRCKALSVSVGADAEGLGEEGEGTWGDILADTLSDPWHAHEAGPALTLARFAEEGSLRDFAAAATRERGGASELYEQQLDLDRIPTPLAGGAQVSQTRTRQPKGPLLAITGPETQILDEYSSETEYASSVNFPSATVQPKKLPDSSTVATTLSSTAAAAASSKSALGSKANNRVRGGGGASTETSGANTPETVPSLSSAPLAQASSGSAAAFAGRRLPGVERPGKEFAMGLFFPAMLLRAYIGACARPCAVMPS